MAIEVRIRFRPPIRKNSGWSIVSSQAIKTESVSTKIIGFRAMIDPMKLFVRQSCRFWRKSGRGLDGKSLANELQTDSAGKYPTGELSERIEVNTGSEKRLRPESGR
jgi:hypothetical protein